MGIKRREITTALKTLYEETTQLRLNIC